MSGNEHPTDPLVSVESLSRRFGEVWALDDVSVQLDGGVVGVLGPNGAGKTTLLRTLATVLPVASGSVRVARVDLSDGRNVREARRVLGYLPQVFGFYGSFTASEFVEYVGWLKEVPRSEIRAATAEVLSLVGMSDRAGVAMRKLSGGQRRRVGIAQAMVNRPRVVLFDEPTAGLDPEQRVTFRSVLRKLGESELVVVSTHLVEDVAAVCSRVLVMGGGRILFDGAPEVLAEHGAGFAEGDSPLERGYLAVLEDRRR